MERQTLDTRQKGTEVRSNHVMKLSVTMITQTTEEKSEKSDGTLNSRGHLHRHEEAHVQNPSARGTGDHAMDNPLLQAEESLTVICTGKTEL